MDKFKLYKKWFWIGIVMAFLNIVAGLVYGIALAYEEGRKKEGLIIVAFAVIWFVFAFYVVGPWLLKSGLIPKFQILKY